MPQKQPPARTARSCDVVMYLLLFLLGKEFAILAVALAFEFVQGNEAQRCRVDAVAQAAGVLRAIVKHVTQMAVAMARPHFGAGHAVTHVGLFFHVRGFYRLGEARPTAVAIELVERRKKRLTRNDIHVNAWFIVIPKGVFKRPLSSALLRHPELLGGQTRYSFRALFIIGHLILNLMEFVANNARGSPTSPNLCPFDDLRRHKDATRSQHRHGRHIQSRCLVLVQKSW